VRPVATTALLALLARALPAQPAGPSPLDHIEGKWRGTAGTPLDRATGRIVWRWAMPEPPGGRGYGFFAPPAVDGGSGRLVVGGLDGSLYGFRTR
jgi:hypothetical protein